jgi:hypothetical protein
VSAVISPCGQFRYLLRRSWDISRPAVTFVMLNPSTADAEQDDPTIRKCRGFADRLGFGALNVVNLFAFRATKPADLKRAGYQRGPECDEWIARAVRETGNVICAWGSNARGLVRPAEVIDILRGAGMKPTALRLTDDGIPWHPLMLPYDCTLIPMEPAHA